MSRIWYDTEFLEAGGYEPIRLISIGLIAEDGAEFYAINEGAPWYAISNNRWLMDNVVRHLPGKRHSDGVWRPDKRNKQVCGLDEIRTSLYDWLRERGELELWADYAAYDHVVLCQIFGRMIDLPEFIPMFTNDIQQESHRLGIDVADINAGTDAHNALEDARMCSERYEYLVATARELGLTAPGDPDRRTA